MKLLNAFFALIVTVIVLLPVAAIADSAKGINPYQIDFLIVSDIHLDTDSPKYKKSMVINPTGYDDSNDLDLNTFAALLAKIPSDINPEFVLMLGDSVAHNAFHREIKLHKPDFTAALKGISQHFVSADLFSPMPIFNVLGNNDATTADYGAFLNAGISPYTIAEGPPVNWKDGFLSTAIKCASAPNQYPCINTLAADDTDYGYYTANLRAGLSLFVLNTVAFSSESRAAHDGADQELTWLATQLDAAAKDNRSVLLAMHIPPESSQWSAAYLSQFKKLIATHSDIITGILAAHTHMEELRAIKLSNGKVIPLIFTAAMSTAHGNAPSVKHMTLTKNAQTGRWELKDYVTYFFQGNDLSSLSVKKYYAFDNQFCPGMDTTVSVCLKSLIPRGKDKFNADSVKLMNEQYTAGNPNNRSPGDATKWVDNSY